MYEFLRGSFSTLRQLYGRALKRHGGKWEHLFNYKWKLSEHINVLELRTILHAIRYHIMHLKACHLRVFHVTDSYICMSVISKGTHQQQTAFSGTQEGQRTFTGFWDSLHHLARGKH